MGVRVYIFAIIVFVFSGISCGTSEEPLFIMDMEADFVIPPGLNSFDTHYFVIRNVPTRIKNYLSQGFDTDLISSIKANRAELNARFVNIDWALVRQIEVHAISGSDPSVQSEIFYLTRLTQENTKELRLLSSLPDVKDILLQDQLTLEIRLNFITTTPIEIETRLTMNFAVNGQE